MKRNLFCLFLTILILGGCTENNNALPENMSHSEVIINTGEDEIVESVSVPEESLPEEDEPKKEDPLSEVYELIREKKYPQAIFLLSQLPGEAEIKELENRLRYMISGDFIATESGFVAAIDSEGNAMISASNEGNNSYFLFWVDEASEWEQVSRFFYSKGELAAVDHEGRVLFAKETERPQEERSIKDYLCLDQLDEIKQLHWDGAYGFALNQQGKVYKLGAGEGEVNEPNEVVKIVGGSNNGEVFFLLRDGTVKPLWGENTEFSNPMFYWKDIVDISYAYGKYVGLKADGSCRIYAPASNFHIQGWSDMIAVSTDGGHVVGLRRDGTVLVSESTYGAGIPYNSGLPMEDAQKVDGWTDVVAVKAGGCHLIGLKSTGEILIAEYNDIGPKNYDVHFEIDTTGFHNLYVPSVTDILETIPKKKP